MQTAVVRGAGVLAAVSAIVYVAGYSSLVRSEYFSPSSTVDTFIPLPVLDKADYDARLLALAHAPTTTPALTATSTATSTKPRLWPVEGPYPNAGAILPFKRVVAYYGNFYSKRMGVLGEYPEEQVLAMLASTTEMWTAADPNTPAIPAIHYIAVVAQGGPATGGKYILRMPDDQIDHALAMAEKINGIVFLDVQVGQSTLQEELPLLEKYLRMPKVHLAIDPEFSMKSGEKPGTVIGTFDAADINYAITYLADLVRQHRLPPKMLVIHRFTQNMITNYKKVTLVPEVQVVIDMDGFGSKAKKRGTYSRVIYPEPVQFTGVKLFYKNDSRPPADGLFTTEEVLKLMPKPIYIQYQ